MMKKGICSICTLLIGSFIILQWGCADVTPKREIINLQTNSEDSVNRAMDKIIDMFNTTYSDYKLFNVWYDENQVKKLETEIENGYKVEIAIVLFTHFKTGNNANDGLNENSEYDKYQWIFVCNGLGEWEIVDRGY